MTTIWIDPQELDAAAMALGEQAMQVQETMTGTRTTCTCEVPRSLVGWLDEELQAITVAALEVALGYLQQAVEIKQRAAQLSAEQSLVTTQGVLPTAPLDLAALIAKGVPGGLSLVIEGGPPIVGPGPSTGGISFSIAGGHSIDTGPAWGDVMDRFVLMAPSGQGAGVADPGAGFWNETGDIARSWMTPPGVTFDNGQYVDLSGNRSTSLTPGYIANDGMRRF